MLLSHANTESIFNEVFIKVVSRLSFNFRLYESTSIIIAFSLIVKCNLGIQFVCVLYF